MKIIENNPFLKPTFYYLNELNYILKNNYTFQLSYVYFSNLFKQFTIPILEDNIQKLKTTTLNFGDAQSIKFAFNTNLSFLQEKLSFNINAALNFDTYNGTLTNNPIHINNFNYNSSINMYLNLSKNKSLAIFTDFNYQSPFKSVEYEVLNTISSLSFGLRKNFSKKLSLFVYLNDVYNGSSILKVNNTLNGFITKNYAEINQFNQSASIRLTYKLGNFNVKSNKERNKANDDLKNRIR